MPWLRIAVVMQFVIGTLRQRDATFFEAVHFRCPARYGSARLAAAKIWLVRPFVVSYPIVV